jgi:hypothetical protein
LKLAGSQFYVDLVLKHKVVPPEAMTWEFDEIIAGGQNDRYVMTQTAERPLEIVDRHKAAPPLERLRPARSALTARRGAADRSMPQFSLAAAPHRS